MLPTMLVELLHIWFLISTTNALYVTAGSPCTTSCKPGNGTWYLDAVCFDSDYSTSPKGQLLQQCMQCQGQSLFVNGSKSDEYWYLWHMKLVQQSCLVETYSPHIAAVEQCATECSPLRTVLQQLWIQKEPYLPQYNYCTNDSSSYPTYAPKCAKCLQSQKGAVIVGNMVETMANACADKPLAINNVLITSSRDLFNTTVIPLSTTTATDTGSSSSTPTSSGALQTASVHVTDNSQGLTAGAAAGIAVGVTALVIGAAAAFALYIRKRKRSKLGLGASTAIPSPSPTYWSGKQVVNNYRNYEEMYQPTPRPELHGHAMLEADGRAIEKTQPTTLIELPAHGTR